MKALAACALVSVLSVSSAFAGEPKRGVSISFDSDDSRTSVVARHAVREARLAITTRHDGATLLLLNDAVAIQLSDAALRAVETKEEASFLEEWLAVGARLMVGKSVEYPIANIRSAEIRGGVLVLTSDQGKPVFDNIKVNGSTALSDFTPADAARFVSAFNASASRRGAARGARPQ
jgi:hypothetical protein